MGYAILTTLEGASRTLQIDNAINHNSSLLDYQRQEISQIMLNTPQRFLHKQLGTLLESVTSAGAKPHICKPENILQPPI